MGRGGSGRVNTGVNRGRIPQILTPWVPTWTSARHMPSCRSSTEGMCPNQAVPPLPAPCPPPGRPSVGLTAGSDGQAGPPHTGVLTHLTGGPPLPLGARVFDQGFTLVAVPPENVDFLAFDMLWIDIENNCNYKDVQ